MKTYKWLIRGIKKPFWILHLRLRRHCSIAFNAKLKGMSNISLGSGASIGHGAILNTDRGGRIAVGKNSGLGPYTFVDSWGGDIVIGDYTTIDSFGVIYGHGGLRIGNHVLIATQVAIVPAQHRFDNVDTPIREQGLVYKGITIEDDVWIGAGVKILDGVTIGKGVVVGAGSVVTRDIPPYSVAVGIPARPVRNRTTR